MYVNFSIRLKISTLSRAAIPPFITRGLRGSERAVKLQLISIIKISLPFMGLAGVSRSEVSFFGSDLWRLLSSETVLPSDLILSCCSRWVRKIYSPLPRRKMGKCFLAPRNSRILIPLRESLRRILFPYSFSPLTALIFHYTLPPPSSLTPLFKPWWNGMEWNENSG